MKIAVVAPPWIKIPPEKYGGIEYLLGLLVDGLVEKNHEVTLFATGDARTKARLSKIFDEEMVSYLGKGTSNFLNIALTHSLASYLEISRGDYDIVHDHTWKEGLGFSRFVDVPIVHTIHSPIEEDNTRFYNLFKGFPGISFVTISDFQQKQLPGLNYVGTVYNAIEVDRYPFRKDKEDFFLYLGRITPGKAPHLACEYAKELGERLILAGKLSERGERDYFDENVGPLLGDGVEYVGEVSEEKKMELFSKAKGFLFPVTWPEPFGITSVEAMACGTPTIAFGLGALPEVVEHEVTGYVVNTKEEFIAAMKRVEEIDPYKCRERAEKMFDAENMVSEHERIYGKILESSERA